MRRRLAPSLKFSAANSPVPFPEFTQLSPNRDLAPTHERAGVCCHHSAMAFDATIAHMLSFANKVSYHCLIAPNGSRCTLVPDDQIAWHAGDSTFLGRSRCNDFLLSLAFAGDTYATPLSVQQIDSAVEWIMPRQVLHGWALDHITDHRQISPGRKTDLNPVEWQRLHTALARAYSTLGKS